MVRGGGSSLAVATVLLIAPFVALAPAAAEETLDPLSEPTHGFGPFLSFKVPSFDGTLIHVDVQLPDGDGPFPVILELTPYSILWEQAVAPLGGTGLDTDTGFTLPNVDFYVPRGYAAAVAHVRGTGESGGCLTVGGEEEGKDGWAVVEALAAQPWASGKVAMKGASYVGTTPIEAAVLNPPHLTTILPMSAVTDWYLYYFENGEQRWNGDIPPGMSYPDPGFWLADGLIPGYRTGAAEPTEATCPGEMAANFWLQDDRNAFWQERDHGSRAGNISTASVLYTHGWNDRNVAPSMINGWFDLVPTQKRAWYQQHGHGVPSSFGAYYEYEHRWLDHFLLGRNNGALELGGVIVQDSAGLYRAEAQWPPADAETTRYHFAEAALVDEAPATEGSGSYTDVPREGGGVQNLLITPFESFGVGDDLVFLSGTLAEEVHLLGAPVVHLEATSDRTDTQFTVILYDVTTGDVVTRGHLDARHRASLAQGVDVVPGERASYEWKLHPNDVVIPAGHQLVLTVSSSNYYVQQDGTLATNTIHWGHDGSWIDLPVAPAPRARTAAIPLPASWGGETPPPPPPGESELIATGSILAGGPHTLIVSTGNLGVSGADSFRFDAPAAGSRIQTVTTDGSGTGYDLDIYVFDADGNQVATCSDSVADPICEIPEGATDVLVAAFFGALLDVEVWTV